MKREGMDFDQLRVIEADGSARILVHAGPGSGKTQVSAMRLAHLISSGMQPSSILVLSFSRSAVRTLAGRIGMLDGNGEQVVEELRHISIRTFDSWTFRILRRSGLQPAELLSRSYEENIADLAAKMEGPDREAIRTLTQGIRHVIIDEFQDLPGVRGRLVLALLKLVSPPDGDGAGFTVLGDAAQGIYGFAARNEAGPAAAQQDCWKLLRRQYGPALQEVELARNYRCTPDLAQITAKLRSILSLEASGEKKLEVFRRFLGTLPKSGELTSAWLDCIPDGSVAILTRTNGEALRVAQKLMGNGVEGPKVAINLHLAGHASHVPGWIAALLAPMPGDGLTRTQFEKIHDHCRVSMGESAAAIGLPRPAVAWARLAHASGLPESATAISMTELHARLDWPDAFPDDQTITEGGIHITTIHQAKGMEFDSVALLESEPRRDRIEAEDENETEAEPEHAEEEASVCFVAISRAGKQLGVIPAGNIYRAPTSREFAGGRRHRLCHWWRGWVNLEMGCPGDIDPFGFVEQRVLGDSAEGVKELQQFLLSEANTLRGHKVMLCRVPSLHNDSHSVYNICLQDGSQPGRILGQTSAHLTQDLLQLLWKKGYALPSRIMNLRIGEIVSIAGPEELPAAVPKPWRSSRLWLGVTLFGTGDFRPFKKNQEYAR